MPLPADNTPWPPVEGEPIFTQMGKWDAWWDGEPDKLTAAYKNQGPGARNFWGRTQTQESPRTDRHVPVAADLCATSADLIYGNPPRVDSKAGNTAETTQRLNEYVETGLFKTLLEGAEAGAALGGRYQQVVVDPSLMDQPFVVRVDADHAIPEFRWGHLVAVTFWSVIEVDNARILRHVERHELVGSGFGAVFHGLYEGTQTNLGRQIPLTAHAVTRDLVVGDGGALAQPLTPGLNVTYIPNITPQRRWRTNPLGRNLGRSDLDGLEGLMDALDETYNSWMRDIRLAKARIFADRSMLESPIITTHWNRTKAPDTFDLDKELFVPVNGIPGREGSAKFLQAEQFAIRVTEHAETANDLMRRIIRGARWSSATFDDDMPGNMTATEVRARQNATATTRDRKITLERIGLLRILRKMITLDASIFNVRGMSPENVSVEFPPLATPTMQEAADTVATLKSAESASLETRLQIVHPEWTPAEMEEEIERLRKEAPLVDPNGWRPTFSTLETDRDDKEE